MTDIVDKPLRRDAERNRRRILDAARELFAERGLTVTLNDIAHHAGVGVGTVYRRFPDKSVLVDSLFEEDVAEVTAMVHRALEEPDPWRGLVGFLREMFERQCANQGLKELLTESGEASARIARVRDELLPMTETLMRRAQASGDLRLDLDATDLAVIQLMVGAVVTASRDVAPDLWKRCFELLLSGMSPHPGAYTPLSTPPLSPGQVDHVLANSHSGPARRRG